MNIADAARRFRDAFNYDPGHSDLDDEQPISISVTLGDWRKLDIALSEKLPINKVGATITVSSTEPQFDPTLPSDKQKTPRTDEEVEIAKKYPGTAHGLWVSAEFARQLERELAEAKRLAHLAADNCDEALERAEEAVRQRDEALSARDAIVCYAPCKQHEGLSWTMKVNVGGPAIKTVCPICTPPSDLSEDQHRYVQQPAPKLSTDRKDWPKPTESK